jgi:hypothetical protein
MSRNHSPSNGWALVALALLAAPACAPENGVGFDASAVTANAPTWIRTDSTAFGVQLALDPSGNVLVASSTGSGGIGVAKYDPAGTPLWQRVFNAFGTIEKASWIAVDGAGNAFVSGYLVFGSSQDPGGFVVLKYDPSGALLWSEVTQVTLGQAVRVETDAAGNAYVTGKGWLASADVDYATIKYAPDGTRQWVRTHGLYPALDEAASLAVSADGRVAVTGSPSSSAPMVTVVYDTDGNVLWSRSAPGGRARDVVFGPAGEVYVAGGTNALVVVKHDAAGGVAWSRSAPGFSAERVGLDAAGNVFVTGTAVQASGMPYTDWMTAKFDPSGRLLWTQRYDAHAYNDEAPRALAVTADGAVIVTGSGGPGPTSGVLSYLQLVTLEYAPDGTLAWIWTTFNAIDGVGLRAAGSSVYGIARSPMTAFRLERAAAGAPAPAPEPAPAPAPAPSPTPPPPTPPPPTVTLTMSVADVTLDVARTGAKYKVTGRVFVRDSAGAAVAGASVTAVWTIPGSTRTLSATTDTAGVATFVAKGTAGTYTLAVRSVVKTGLVFDATTGVLSRSVTAP